MIKLRAYQQQLRAGIYDAWDNQGLSNVLGVLPTGGGKCLGKGTLVLMYSGETKKVEDIKVGDLVMGPDSRPRLVSGTTTGREKLYRVTPVKGDPYVVNKSHILSFKETGTYKIKNVSVLDYLAASATWKHTHKGWRTGVDFSEKKYSSKLPPYFLGLWLGDGHSDGPTVTTADIEIATYMVNFADETHQRLRIELYPDNKSRGFHLSSNFARTGTRQLLKEYNLIHNKHIPLEYKTGSREQRLQLLAGVVDSDGHFDGKNIDLVLKVKTLADDVAFLARSLGFAAYPVKCSKTCCNTGAVGEYYRMSISGDFSVIPSKLLRNKFKPRAQKKSVLVTGIKLEDIGEGEYFGFSLRGPDRLFLLGDFTVTHNTATFSDIILDRDAPSVAIAHRQELVGQISTALARNGVKHRIIGPPKVVKMCVNLHMEKVGRSYFDPSSWHAVAGVDTLIRRTKELESWSRSVRYWVEDEAHHVLMSNKWGKSVEMFPNARGLGVTATPTRADGKGLGAHADGVFEAMVEGPSMRELIELGYLTDYDIYAPESDYHRPTVVGNSGDYTRDGMRAAAKQSRIVGDVVASYLKFASGKLGVTFVPDLETAAEMAAQFNAAGIPAEVVSSESTDEERISALRRFENRQLLQLVNVDLFGEGFDLPAIEVVSFARPTASLSLYIQQFGRVLRLFIPSEILSNWESYTPAQRKHFIATSSKPTGIVIDHVGNVKHHRLPDARREWTLDRRNSRGDSDRSGIIPVWTCHVCSRTQVRIYDPCKFCGHPKPLPAVRSGPEHVDGDLVKIDPLILAQMREEIAEVDLDSEIYRQELVRKRCPTIGQQAHVNRHLQKQAAQKDLRESLAWWGGLQRTLGRSDSESYRRFYFAFGVDIMTAQTLGHIEAYQLKHKVDEHLKNVIRN